MKQDIILERILETLNKISQELHYYNVVNTIVNKNKLPKYMLDKVEMASESTGTTKRNAQKSGNF